MFSTMELTNIESMLDATLPCETTITHCNKEPNYRIVKVTCGCDAFLCSEHLDNYLQRIRDWHDSVYGMAGLSHCRLCGSKFTIPEHWSDVYNVIPI